MTRSDGEDGYALVAAVASIAVFAAMAMTVLSATRIGVVEAGAEQAQLQASAAADAGLAMTLGKLLSRDLIGRWPIDGRERRLRYGDAEIRVRIEDERGKVPIGRLDDALATRLLEEVGLDGDRLRIARDSLLDWIDDDDMTRPFGAEAPYYRATGIAPANGFLATIEELNDVRGFDAATVERVRTVATTYTAMASFDPRYADPRALAVMQDAGGKGGAVAAIERARELSGQQAALSFADAPDLTGRPVTITVTVAFPDSTRATRRTVVQLTGVAASPYVVLASD